MNEDKLFPVEHGTALRSQHMHSNWRNDLIKFGIAKNDSGARFKQQRRQATVLAHSAVSVGRQSHVK